MTNFEGNQNFKNSGVQWLGYIPADWKTTKIKWLTSIKRGASPRPIDDPKYFDDQGEYAWVRIADVSKSKMYLEITTQRMSGLGSSLSIKREPGDIFLSIAGTVGKPCITNVKCCIHDGFVYFPNYKGDVRFLYYIFESGEPYKGLGKMGTQLNLNTDIVGAIVIPDINMNLQKAISDYLDSKTQEIDSLIAAKEKLIDLLEEKRQSMITEAVTKGLNPNVKMKDSCVEWIGEIPEHWEVNKIGYLGRLQNGISKSADEFGHGYSFVSYSDVYKNTTLPQAVNGLVNSSEEEQELYSVREGDVFFTRTSETIEEIGISSTCLKTIDKATFAGFLIRFRPTTQKLLASYSKYYFRSDLGRRYFVKEVNLVTRASLGQGLLRNFPVILPPLEEQKGIAEYLDIRTRATDESINLIKIQIKKLKNYRQSLIYEAVTGKIDVRDFKVES
ncbi:restriction endonuclease subunit S [Bacillus fungorum]|uniref:restriction endonuclease subunit S n=1 Tax=Bacillus fungorum TaxID=2039284 RepID=UPI003393F517